MSFFSHSASVILCGLSGFSSHVVLHCSLCSTVRSVRLHTQVTEALVVACQSWFTSSWHSKSVVSKPESNPVSVSKYKPVFTRFTVSKQRASSRLLVFSHAGSKVSGSGLQRLCRKTLFESDCSVCMYHWIHFQSVYHIWWKRHGKKTLPFQPWWSLKIYLRLPGQ